MSIIGKAIILGKKAEVANQVTLINFTIAEDAYQAEEGMTWAEWVNSNYNSNNFYVASGATIDTKDRSTVYYNNGLLVSASENIINEHSYILRTHVSPK